MAKTLRKLEKCPNCDKPLTGDINFCAECGQENTTKSVSVRYLIRDFLDDYFTLDSRLIKSIIPLITKPGFLTNEFNHGRRVKFVPPLRMYIVFSLLFFIVPSSDHKEEVSNEQTVEEVHAQLEEGVAQMDSIIPTVHKSIGFKTDSLGNRGMNINIGNFDQDRIGNQDYQDSLVQTSLDSLAIAKGTKMRTFLERLGLNAMDIIADDGDQFTNNLMGNVPKMMFFLLPFFALLIQIFYYRKKPLYVESIIFSLHFHSFAFLMFAVSDAIRWGGMSNNAIEFGFLLAIVVYLIVALKNVFHQKYWVTTVKFVGLFFTYGLVMALSFGITFLLTLITY